MGAALPASQAQETQSAPSAREVKEATLGAGHLALFRELGDLKRIHSADAHGSIAERLFVVAWQSLMAGNNPSSVMAHSVAAALAATRLGDLDRRKLEQLGLATSEAVEVLERGFSEVGAVLDPALTARLNSALAETPLDTAAAPNFVLQLCRQPRAGVTCPGRPRLMLEPAENHAEHSFVVALYGVLAAPVYGADPTAVFMAAMGHHLHSAAMPDSGYTGEVLLQDKLGLVIDRARALAFVQLPTALAAALGAALAPIASDRTPEARAFHAADVIDRVLEIEHHLQAARITMGNVLADYGLVHAGPVKQFHDRVLKDVGLL